MTHAQNVNVGHRSPESVKSKAPPKSLFSLPHWLQKCDVTTVLKCKIPWRTDNKNARQENGQKDIINIFFVLALIIFNMLVLYLYMQSFWMYYDLSKKLIKTPMRLSLVDSSFSVTNPLNFHNERVLLSAY